MNNRTGKIEVTHKDVAIIEVLHDYIFEVDKRPLKDPALVNARELTKRMRDAIDSKKNEEEGYYFVAATFQGLGEYGVTNFFLHLENKNFSIQEVEELAKKKMNDAKSVVITNFQEISKEFFEANQ